MDGRGHISSVRWISSVRVAIKRPAKHYLSTIVRARCFRCRARSGGLSKIQLEEAVRALRMIRWSWWQQRAHLQTARREVCGAEWLTGVVGGPRAHLGPSPISVRRAARSDSDSGDRIRTVEQVAWPVGEARRCSRAWPLPSQSSSIWAPARGQLINRSCGSAHALHPQPLALAADDNRTV